MKRFLTLAVLAGLVGAVTVPADAQSRCKAGQEYDEDSGKCRTKRGS